MIPLAALIGGLALGFSFGVIWARRERGRVWSDQRHDADTGVRYWETPNE